MWFFCKCFGAHRYQHVLTHSCPTRRSSDLTAPLSIVVAPAVVTLHAVVARSVRRVSQGRRRHARHQQQRQNSLFHGPSSLSSPRCQRGPTGCRSEQHTSELQSLMRLSYAVFCLKKKNKDSKTHTNHNLNTSQADI